MDALNGETYIKEVQGQIRDLLTNYRSALYQNVYGFDTTTTSMHAMFFPSEQLSFPTDFARYDKLMRGNVPNRFINRLKQSGFFTQYYTNDCYGHLNSSLPLSDFDSRVALEANLFDFTKVIRLQHKSDNFLYLHEMLLHDKLGQYIIDSRFSSEEYKSFTKLLTKNILKTLTFLLESSEIDHIVILSDHGMTINKDSENNDKIVPEFYALGDFKSKVFIEVFSRSREKNTTHDEIITLLNFQDVLNKEIFEVAVNTFKKNITYLCEPSARKNIFDLKLNTFVHRDVDKIYAIQILGKTKRELTLTKDLKIESDTIDDESIRLFLLNIINSRRMQLSLSKILGTMTNVYSIIKNKLHHRMLRK